MKCLGTAVGLLKGVVLMAAIAPVLVPAMVVYAICAGGGNIKGA